MRFPLYRKKSQKDKTIVNVAADIYLTVCRNTIKYHTNSVILDCIPVIEKDLQQTNTLQEMIQYIHEITLQI